MCEAKVIIIGSEPGMVSCAVMGLERLMAIFIFKIYLII
jgi:hypothetical protein